MSSRGIRAVEGLALCELERTQASASVEAFVETSSVRADARASLETLIRDNRERLLVRIRNLMGAEARRSTESVDVLHGVLSRALEERARAPRDPASFLRWLTAMARHRIVDEVRRRRDETFDGGLHEPIGDRSPSIASFLSLQEAEQRMLAALDELGPVHRRVVELRCLEELPWFRIAGELGRSEEAVRKLYHRSLLELGRRLGPECGV